jgi:uncharacterized membrane protein YhaH (DUF805 family)
MTDWLPYSRAGGTDGAAPMQPHAPISDAQDPARSDANTFLGALKDGFSRYVDFKTRSTRSQYWWWFVWSLLIDFAARFADSMMGAGQTGPLGSLTFLVILIPSIALAIRRLHDIGRTGWWLLLIFVPFVGWIVLIVFYCTKTQEAANQWGLPPNR